jgi:hypothetical protein
VLKDLIDGWPPAGVVVEDALDEVPGSLSDSDILGEGIVVHPDPFVSCFDIVGLEWGLADDKGIDDDAQRPDVDLI